MSKHNVIRAVANAGLFNDIDGDIGSEIGVFCLMHIPMDTIKLTYMARDTNLSVENDDLPDITADELREYSGWGIFHERGNGASYWHAYDTAEEALADYKAMGETYATELGL